jgi:hypothetical protein
MSQKSMTLDSSSEQIHDERIFDAYDDGLPFWMLEWDDCDDGTRSFAQQMALAMKYLRERYAAISPAIIEGYCTLQQYNLWLFGPEKLPHGTPYHDRNEHRLDTRRHQVEPCARGRNRPGPARDHQRRRH